MASELRLIRWTQNSPVTEQEAEARLHQEGYQSFRWYDVAGANYPRHRHACDECLWVLEGEIVITVDGSDYALGAGDRLYLPKGTAHTAHVPPRRSVTYLVGQK